MKEISINFKITKKDLNEYFYRAVAKQIIFVSIPFVLGIFGVHFLMGNNINGIGEILLTTTLIIYYVFSNSIKFLMIRKSVFENPYLLEEKNIYIDENCIILKQTNLECQKSWGDITYVVFGKYNTYLYGKLNRLFTFIPKSSFSSEDEIVSFKDQIVKKAEIRRL
ncbi:hypothetical protein R9X47_15650 [Wukongibacter baidiensis]|uniref:hypothetical protein n=1 Tax=Wukongibacter baidiensis TaxID=1723361 RepID=UPI003D7FB3E8